MRIRLYEWLAGKLLVRSARLRMRRAGARDAHELRHLWAALNAGNSDNCLGAMCTLERLSTPAVFPRVWWYPSEEPNEERPPEIDPHLLKWIQ